MVGLTSIVVVDVDEIRMVILRRRFENVVNLSVTMLIQMVPGLLLTRLLLTNTTSSKQRSSHILMPSTKLELNLIKFTLLRHLTVPRLTITQPNLPTPSRHCKTLRLSSKQLSKKPAKQVLTWLVPRLPLRQLPTN